MEKKIQWDVGSQGLFGKDLSEVVHICLENWFFLSISPRHSSKHTILNIHLNMHILAIVVCVHVSVLVSVYIIRVHCPLHHTLDTFYGLFAKKIKAWKNITKFPKYLHSNFWYKLSCKKEIEMNMGWNGDAYEMMKHEMKRVSSTRYETNQSYHDKSKKINIKETSKDNAK
jgi:hypothetical protein